MIRLRFPVFAASVVLLCALGLLLGLAIRKAAGL